MLVVSDEQVDAEAAEEKCVSLGGHLAVILSFQKKEQLMHELNFITEGQK